MPKKKKVWYTYEHEIIQAFPVTGWYAVFLKESGEREIIDVDFMALVETTTTTRANTGGTMIVVDVDKDRSLDGLLLGELKFQPCSSFSGFLGMAKKDDIYTVDYASGDLQYAKIHGLSTDGREYDYLGRILEDADNYFAES